MKIDILLLFLLGCVSVPVGRALGSHSRGQRFESAYLHHFKKDGYPLWVSVLFDLTRSER